MTMQQTIEKKLAAALVPEGLQVENESHQHAGPAMDSHFKVTIISRQFADMGLVKRHQAVYAALADELAGPVHALSIHAYAPAEWQGAVPESPACLGQGH